MRPHPRLYPRSSSRCPHTRWPISMPGLPRCATAPTWRPRWIRRPRMAWYRSCCPPGSRHGSPNSGRRDGSSAWIPCLALNRIRNAATAAGLTEGVTKRRLFLLRNDEWSGGPRTKEVVAAFEAAGGERLPLPVGDIKILVALRDLLRIEDQETLQLWFVARKPTREISFLRRALSDAAPELTMKRDGAEAPGEPEVDVTSDPADRRVAHPSTLPAERGVRSITVGTALDSHRPVRVDLEALRRHAAIFAGSGSGKTVLIRRLVEE